MSGQDPFLPVNPARYPGEDQKDPVNERDLAAITLAELSGAAEHSIPAAAGLDAEVETDPIEDVIILNADFKWKEGKLSVLEIADGINNSEFRGYNALYGAGPNDERMFKKIADTLASHFQFLYAIHHTTKGTPYEIPVAQLHSPNLKVFDTYFDFIDYIRREKPDTADSVLIVGESLGVKPLDFAPRSLSEVKLFLHKQGIRIPVVNSAEMCKLADDKVIFAMACPGGVPHSCLVSQENFSEKIDLFLSRSTSPYVVLKPPNEQKGRGVKIIRREDLLAIQSQWQSNTLALAQIPLLYTMLQQYGHFLLQDYVASDALAVDNASYDPTGRAVFILYKTVTGCYTMEGVDMYWKLPELSLAEGERQASQVSYSGEDNRVFSAKVAPSSKVAITAAFTDFFRSPALLFLSALDFCTHYYLSLPGDVRKYFLPKIQGHGIDIPSVDIGKHLERLGKRFSFGWDTVLLKSLILMVQNNIIESMRRPDLRLCTEEADALFAYLMSERCVNTLLLPPASMEQELAMFALFPRYKKITKLTAKIARSRLRLQRLAHEYNLANTSPLELAKGLRRAAASGREEDLALFLEVVEDSNASDSQPDKKYTPLHLAVEKKHYLCVRLLLENGAKFTLKNAAGETVQQIIEEGEDGHLKVLLFGVALIAQMVSSVQMPGQRREEGASYRRVLAGLASLEVTPLVEAENVVNAVEVMPQTSVNVSEIEPDLTPDGSHAVGDLELDEADSEERNVTAASSIFLTRQSN